MLAFAMVTRKSFYSKFVAKISFSYQKFNVTISNADMGSLIFLHTLFDKYLYYMLVEFEQNRMLRNIHKFELFGQKMVNHF